MATINYYIKSKKNPANIYARFSHKGNIDTFVPIGVYVNPKHWDKKRKKLRLVAELPKAHEINIKLNKLETYTIEQFNLAYMEGIIIDKDWIKKTISSFFKRPEDENKKSNKFQIYLTEFADYWMDNHSKNWRVGKNNFMSEAVLKQYRSNINLIKEFEDNNYKIKFREITESTGQDFAEYLEDQNYQPATIKRHGNRFKFWCNRAIDQNIVVNKKFNNRIFVKPRSNDKKEPYLNYDEIQRIFNKDFSYSERLDNARDNFIIGLWTGLRVSDFLKNLDIYNIKDGFIDIKAEKTNTFVSIPLHPMVKHILNKRNGNLPKKISDVKFNLAIKDICQAVDIDEEMYGGTLKKTEDGKRKVWGTYKKYKLVTSHICRRSFATNLYGKIPDNVLQSVCGWKSKEMMLHYIKKSNREHAQSLKDYWDITYADKNIKELHKK